MVVTERDPRRRVVVLAKRHYTNKDALRERYGRVYELPHHWMSLGAAPRLELLDYYGRAPEHDDGAPFPLASTPTRSPRALAVLYARLRTYSPEIVVASGDCFVGLLAWRVSRSLSARFVFDIYDDYRHFGAYRLFLGWDAYGFLARRADRLFYASQALRLADNFTTPATSVPNGVDPEQFRPWERDAARSHCGLTDDGAFLIGYFGSLDAARGIDDLLAAAALLRTAGIPLRLLVCGPARRGLSLDLPWVDFRGPVSHHEIPAFVNACDIVALPYRQSHLLDMSSSCKIAEYLLCERPVVATQTPNLVSNFPRQARELGTALCRPNDPADLARAIRWQLAARHVVSRPEEHTWAQIAQRAWKDMVTPIESART